MSVRWGGFCRAKDLSVDGPHIDIELSDGRRQRVTVEEQDDSYLLSAIVARRAVVSASPDLPIQACLRNRMAALVGFRVDRSSRLVGEAWVPKEGLSAEEFQFYVRTVAAACDRFEYVLTGRDVE